MLSSSASSVLLASREAQWDFERSRPRAQTPRELLGITSDLPSGDLAFTTGPVPEDLPGDIVPAQHHPFWVDVMERAQEEMRGLDPDWVPQVAPPPVMDNPVGSWGEYFDSMMDKPVHPLYHELATYLPSGGNALELAAGVGQGARFLLDKGQTVWANDAHGEALTILYEHAPKGRLDRLHVRVLSFENLNLAPGFFDVVSAGFCLFFMAPALFAKHWPMLVASLRPEGLFAGQFIGPRDDWSAAGYLSHSHDEVERLLEPFEILTLEEVERNGKTSQGYDKHWHVFHVVARLKNGQAGEPVASPYR